MATIAALIFINVPAGAEPYNKQHQQIKKVHLTGIGLVISNKTGAVARVSPTYQAKFQAYIDDLEAAGASVKFMGGYRHERCAPPRHKHACGMALDVCQLRRGIVRADCHLPAKSTMIAIAARHGLTEGGQWCNNDRGHAEAGASAGACGTRYVRRLGNREARL